MYVNFCIHTLYYNQYKITQQMVYIIHLYDLTGKGEIIIFSKQRKFRLFAVKNFKIVLYIDHWSSSPACVHLNMHAEIVLLQISLDLYY